MKPSALIPLALGLLPILATAQSYYKEPALFSTRPDEKKSNTTITRFDPANPKEANRAPMQALNLKPDGTTGDPLVIWSGDNLMDLRKNEALQMRIESFNGTDYLFIEAGGFQTKSGNTWKCPWFVLKRQ